MRVRVKATPGGLFATAFVVGASFIAIHLYETVYLDALATPTAICIQEVEASAIAFLIFMVVAGPAGEALARSDSRVLRVLRTKVRLPLPLRAAAALALAGGSFVFVFWSVADVLGGYNGYGYSFQVHPILHVIHNSTIGLIPYLGTRDKGTQASFFFAVSILGMITLRLGSGIGRAVKDTATLFAAPILVLFELALWPAAPEDMTWHVTDYLWMGGTNDGGYRILDVGGAYLFSNWLLLAVCLLLVATRIPWATALSTLVWRRGGAKGEQAVEQAAVDTPETVSSQVPQPFLDRSASLPPEP